MSKALAKIERQGGTLAEMSVPQMSGALVGLDRLETQYENMSGICATLKGLVLIEAKARLEHGKFMPFVKRAFPKKHKTANRYMRIAEECQTKLDTNVQFEALARDLAKNAKALQKFNLDVSHPLVSPVAKWVDGRSAYQLLKDIGEAERGGDTSTKRKRLSAEEKHQQFLKTSREDFTAAITRVDALVVSGNWKAPSITDAELEASVDVAQQFVKAARTWLNTPKKQRNSLEAKS